MKNTTQVNGVTLTRAQVEQALKDLNTPEPATRTLPQFGALDLACSARLMVNIGYLKDRARCFHADDADYLYLSPDTGKIIGWDPRRTLENPTYGKFIQLLVIGARP